MNTSGTSKIVEIDKEISQMEETVSKDILKEMKSKYTQSLLYIKILHTLYYKLTLFEDISFLHKNKYDCYLECYNNIDENEMDRMKDSSEAKSTVTRLKSCTSECNKPTIDAEKYIDNIDYLSLTKLNGCSNSCQSVKRNHPEYNLCIWNCYNKLDRRYRGYWNEHKNKLINRYYHDIV